MNYIMLVQWNDQQHKIDNNQNYIVFAASLNIIQIKRYFLEK